MVSDNILKRAGIDLFVLARFSSFVSLSIKFLVGFIDKINISEIYIQGEWKYVRALTTLLHIFKQVTLGTTNLKFFCSRLRVNAAVSPFK